jgi:hypothetical protein
MSDTDARQAQGVIALMGSGELTSTMVEVHKGLLAGLSVPPKSVFLDTPAGFQLNVDQISQRAVDYFRRRIGTAMDVASYKSGRIPHGEAERALQLLHEAGYLLIGPGSPTYAVRQWKASSIPLILEERIRAGGCLVAASAAALTVGRFTLPVYEVYKVGRDLYWEPGIDLLGRFGMDLVVIPHWNNAEGGTHDTRFCYMGESRFRALEDMLPEEVTVCGLDEHTACLLDLAENEARIKGIGTVTLLRGGRKMVFSKGERFPLDVLLHPLSTGSPDSRASFPSFPSSSPPSPKIPTADPVSFTPFWERIHRLESEFQTGLDERDPLASTQALLELDRIIWEAQQDLENPEFISQAREILREFMVYQGLRLELSPDERRNLLAPLVEACLRLREDFRHARRWDDADTLRDALLEAGVMVEDAPTGPRWSLKS